MTIDLLPAEMVSDILANNLRALRDTDDAVARHRADAVEHATGPAGAQPVRARDESTTWAWDEPDGHTRFLGGTTMPRVRAEALVEAFEAGTGNVLLEGIGTGWEVRLLLERMGGHQGVFVVEEQAWQARAAMTLHDYEAALRAGRLILLTGDSAWSDLRAFLLAHEGYLTPDRVLAWPWYGVEETVRVRDRVEALGAEVARRRGERFAALTAGAAENRPNTPALAVLSTHVDIPTQSLAERIEAGARANGLRTLRRTMQSPGVVHPLETCAALDAIRPETAWLIATIPGELPYRSTHNKTVVCVPQPGALDPNWLERVPRGAVLTTATAAQRQEAIAAGWPPRRVIQLRPAALPGLTEAHARRAAASHPMRSAPRVLFLADGHDPSAEALGLHLASHCHLWREATALLRERAHNYRDDHAEAILADAEARIGVRLQSADVRRGLVDRIRQVLGPTIVAQTCWRALVETGVDCDIVGAGWEFDAEAKSRRRRNCWPAADEVAAFLMAYSIIVSIETGGRVRFELMDALSAGLTAVVRAHPADATPDGWAGVLDSVEDLPRVNVPSDLAETVRRLARHPNETAERSRRIRESIHARHGWDHRVREVLDAFAHDL